MTKLAGDVRL